MRIPSFRASMPRLLVLVVLTVPLTFVAIYGLENGRRFFEQARVSRWKSNDSRDSEAKRTVFVFPRTSSIDRRQEIYSLREQLAELRKSAPASSTILSQILLQLAKLESAIGNEDAATTTLQGVLELHADTNHWQVREATTRLEILRRISSASKEDRKLWQSANDEHSAAETSHEAGRYLDALARADLSLGMRRRLWGSDNAETVESSLILAGLCTDHADAYLRADGLARVALEQIRRVWGPDHPANANCLHIMARLADDRGDFETANRLYEEALTVFRGSLGELSREFASTLNRQGRMHNTWWKDFGAGKSFRALQIREQILDREHIDCAESLEDLGEVAYSLLNFSRAEMLLNEAIEIRHRLQSADHPDISRAQSLLAICQVQQGNVSEAVVNARRALSRSERCRGRRHPLVAEQRNVVATIEKRGLTDYSAAYLTSQKTLDDLRELGHQGHPNFCRAIFEQGESLRGEATFHLDDNDIHPTLMAAQRRVEEAIDSYRSLPQGEKIGYYGEALSSLLEIYYYQNYPDDSREKARQLTEELERVVVQNGGRLHPAYALVSLAQGRYCQSRGIYDQAIPFLTDCQSRVHQQVGTSYPWLLCDTNQALAGIYLHQGIDLVESRRRSGLAFDGFNDLFLNNAPGQSDSTRLPFLTDSFYMVSMELSVAELQNDLPSAYNLVLGLRGLAASFEAAQRIADDRPELRELQQEARRTRLALKSVALSSDASEGQSAWVDRLHQVTEQSDIAESELAIATRSYADQNDEVQWREIQQKLPPRTAFIDFTQYIYHESPPNHQGRLLRQRRILAYILKNDGPPVAITLGSSRDIERAIESWRTAIDDFQRGEAVEIEQPTHDLARLVWNPILKHLSDVDRLMISPDGPLCFLSFAALPGRKPETFAIEDFEIGYVNSGRWLNQILGNRRAPRGNGLLLCGDINYQPISRSTVPISRDKINREPMVPDPHDWKNLAATGLEIEQVAGLYQSAHKVGMKTRMLTKSDATAEALEEALSNNWRCIHFAGHGFFIDPDKARPLAGQFSETLGRSIYFIRRNQLLLSGLVLAPADGTHNEPSFLTGKDVGCLNLRETDLVVLSACETGLGCRAGSDGIMGLTRSFLTAGSRSVMSSLWKVDDSATSFLMEEFYRNLWERGQRKSEALRNAQIAVLRSPDSVSERSQYLVLRGVKPGSEKSIQRGTSTSGRSHPALWAAFVLNGDGG